MAMNKQEAAVKILATLEELEAQQINVGLYATHVTAQLICERITQQQNPEDHHDPITSEETREVLLQLAHQGEIIQWQPGYFRSRIAETVRLLRLLRQRFWEQKTRKDLFNKSPLLIEDIRVEFRRRRRPLRTLSIEEELKALCAQGLNSAVADTFQTTLNSYKKPFTSMSDFQARALKQIFTCAQNGNPDNKSFIVAGDTGAGKTEAFFFPILLDISNEPEDIRKCQGVRAVLVYPRIRLARNQLTRLLKYTSQFKKNGGSRITLGIQNGNVPDRAQRIEDKKWDKQERDGTIWYKIDLLEGCSECNDGSYWVRGNDPAIDSGYPLLVCNKCQNTIDTLCITHAALKKNAPDIFIITDVSLSQWMTRTEYSHLWGLWQNDAWRDNEEPTIPPRFLVLDEVHLYEQLKGAHIARLIKRFQARVRLVYKNIGRPSYHPIVIGVSATLRNENAFFSKLLDIDPRLPEFQHIICIKPREGELEYTSGRERYIFIYPRNLSPTPEKSEYRVNDQAAAIQIIMASMHNLMSQNEAWRGLAFFDSINDLRQFRHDYDDPNIQSNKRINGRQPPANQSELWRIRTNRRKLGGGSDTVDNDCGGSCENRAANATLFECPHFQDGDCWVFAKLYGCNRRLRVADSVYANAKDEADLDNKDLIPTSPSLEVGYDDDGIQLVYQHKAPSNNASFIQRRGRAGRNPQASPVIVTLLWPYRREDVFYFFYPEALYDPQFDDVPLNAGNFTVQRTHTLLAFFDLLACWRRQNIKATLTDPNIIDFTRAGKEYLVLKTDVIQRIEPTNNRIVVRFRSGKEKIFSGRQVTEEYVKALDGGKLQIVGWLAMQEEIGYVALQSAWKKLSENEDFDNYILSSNVASEAFRSHFSYPFYRKILPHGSDEPTRLLSQFGNKDYHSSNDRDRDNWLKTFHYIDWMLQGNQDATTLTVHYPNPDESQALYASSLPKDTLTLDMNYALTDLLPGNVSYRLREQKATHWTPIPRDGESTFLYPLEKDPSDEKHLVNAYEPKPNDIAREANSLFGVSQYLYEHFRDLQFITLERLRVEQFGVPEQSQSEEWFFLPTKMNGDATSITEGHAICLSPRQKKPREAFRISRSSSARAHSVIIPFTSHSNHSAIITLSEPLDLLFNSIEGYVRDGAALPGYYRVFYEMHIDVKGGNNQKASLCRHFYPPHPKRDQDGNPKPVLVGYTIRTHGICFQINPDLVEEALERIQSDQKLRLHLRRNFAVYQMAPKSAEWELFIQTQLEYTEIVVDYWLEKVVAPNEGEPRMLEAEGDFKPLVEYYRTHRIVRDAEVNKFRESISNNEDFFPTLNKMLITAFGQEKEFHEFVTSVLLHSLATLLKNLIARLGGVSSDELVAYADLPTLKQVDKFTFPRILVMDTVEGGSGGIAQAFDRLDLNDNNEGSLCWTLLKELGHCPIGNGEAYIKTVLTSITTEQIKYIQSAASSNSHSGEQLETWIQDIKIPAPGKEAIQMLGRVLFKDVKVDDQLHINPALVLRELFTLHEELEQKSPSALDRRTTILYVVNNFNKSRWPAIAQLRAALENKGVAGGDLNHEFALQMYGLFNSACVDGCPICASAGSDIEHIYLAPRLSSRRALKALRESLNAKLPRGQSASAVSDAIESGSPAILTAEPGRLNNRLDRSLGMGAIPEIDEQGRLQGATNIVVNTKQAKDTVIEGNWSRWTDKPYKTPQGVDIRTKAEYLIAAILEDEKIAYEYEPRLPYRDKGGQTKYIHPSFHLYEDQWYIECWGRREAEYVEDRQYKETIYELLQRSRGTKVLYFNEEETAEGEKIREKILNTIGR